MVRAYGVRWPVVGLAQRATFVIGKDLRIRLAYRDELHMTAHVDRALAVLGAAPSPEPVR